MCRRPILLKTCLFCNVDYQTKVDTQKYCNRLCKNEHQKITQKGRKMIPKFGAENPNFGKKWTDERKIRQSEIIKSKVDDAYREKAGSANRGVKFSQERIDKMHSHRTLESYSRIMPENSKILIGIKSKQKFENEDFRINFRKTMEDKGIWIPLEIKDDIEIYYNASNWNKRLFDVLYEDNKELIQNLGVYNTYTNTKGVVRDHMLSRNTGFHLKVFPEIIRHVENCEILEHAKNVKKRFKEKDSISLDELFKRIENTKHIWHEQDLCLNLIKEYKNGKRWERKEV